MSRLLLSGSIPEILVVDDNPSDLQLLGEAFSESGVPLHLHHANDGEQAFARLAKEGRYAGTPDVELIILDLNMPKLDGRAVLAKLMDDQRWRAIPIVVLTSSSRTTDIAYCSQMGALSYFVKPSNWDEYLAMARTLKGMFTPGSSPSANRSAAAQPAPSPSAASAQQPARPIRS